MTTILEADDEGEVTYEVTPKKRGRGRPSKSDVIPEEPVENDEPLPLFPNVDRNSRNVIAFIRVHKRTPPGDGFKADVPPTTTLDLIGKRWGDGIYDLEAMNEAHVVLRRNQNIKIAFGMPPIEGVNRPMPNDGLAERLLDRQATQHDRDADRAHRQSTQAQETATSLATNYAAMVREDSNARIARDREYYAVQSTQQQNFFGTLLASMQTMHRQTMDIQTASFNQTIQMMQASNAQMLQANNPAMLLSLFERGMRMGQDISGADDPISSVLNAGVGGLREIKDMMLLQSNLQPAKLPVGAPTAPAKTRQNPVKKPGLSREELTELMRLKKLAARKGYDFENLVKQAQVMVEQAPDEAQDDESEDDEDEDSEPVGRPTVARGKPTNGR